VEEVGVFDLFGRSEDRMPDLSDNPFPLFFFTAIYHAASKLVCLLNIRLIRHTAIERFEGWEIKKPSAEDRRFMIAVIALPNACEVS
jgi:hypothetical protein